jgi:hypothetical protein
MIPNPFMPYSTMPQAPIMPTIQPTVQPVQQPQQQIRVSGRDEAMNRFIMMYPAHMLSPGFISDPLFDIDGQHFHTLSIESDGSRNLETFSYQLDAPKQTTPDYVTREEFKAFVDQMTGANNGIHEPVQAATTEQPAQ